MAESVIFPKPSGATYIIPDVNDENWGQNVTNYLVALPNGVVPTSGTFTLTGDLSWGSSFGLLSKYFTSLTANPSTAGVVRLAHSDSVGFRNNANNGNLLLSVNSSDQLLFNGAAIPVVGGFVSSITGTANEIIASAATGAVTLSTPQPIATSSSPTFAGVNTGNINGTFIGLGRNRIVNGGCMFDQIKEGGVYSVSTAAHYTLDQWRCEATGTPKFSAQQSTDAPTGFQNSILFTTTVSGSPAAGDGCNIEQVVEGPYARDFNFGTASAVPLTLQFQVKASVTGVYSISFLNQASNRSYVSTYTVNSAGTWETKTVSLLGDTSGTWPVTSGAFGLKVVWDSGSGSSVTTSTLNSWQAGGLWKATGSVSLVANAAATLKITGVQLEIGSIATAFEYVPYPIALQAVRRYVYKTFPQGTAAAAGSGLAGAIGYVAQQPGLTSGGSVNLSLPTEMNPQGSATVTFYNPIVPASSVWYNSTQSLASGAASVALIDSRTNIVVQNAQVAGDAGGDVLYVHLLLQSQVGGA